MARQKLERFEANAKAVATCVVNVTCQNNHTIVLDEHSFEIVGGCGGHSPGEYCYCDSARVVINWSCNQCPPVLDNWTKQMVPKTHKVEIT